MADQSANYEMLEELGSGSFGVVYKALDRTTGELVAVKHIDLDGTDDDIRDIQQEISLLSTCSSPFVTKYITSFVRSTKLWIVMEYLGGGSCLDLIKAAPVSEAHAAAIVRELLLGLDYLHTSGKIHRDIKAANILLSHTGKVKIADFGVAAQLTNIKSQRMTFVGTPFWMAPEVIMEMGYDCKADIWSLGITAIELVISQPPNSDLHPMKALFHIPKSPPPRLEGTYSREMKSFVAACLIKRADHRPSARELLQHRWIQKAPRAEILKDFVLTRQQQLTISEEPSYTRYYEETLRDMARPAGNDDWVFDTIKPTTNITTNSTVTIKKRKFSDTTTPSEEPPTELLRNLDLNLNEATSTNPWGRSPAPQPPTIRNIRPVTPPLGTARKVSSPLKQIMHTPSKNSPNKLPRPTPPRKTDTPSRKSSAQKQPLALDMSFGNGQSSARPFRRVSDQSPVLGPGEIPSNNENVPPIMDAVTKEAKLGRRLFARIIDPAVQEIYAQTASKTKQEALSKVGQALAAMDMLDPEGEFLLLKAIFERVQNDPKLTSVLQIQPTRTASHPPQLQAAPPPQPPQSVPSTPSKSPQKSKLVLSQNNPHLAQHKQHRQSSQVSLLSAAPQKTPQGLPGQCQPGMEHTKQLADALYGRWAEGLKSRWGQV